MTNPVPDADADEQRVPVDDHGSGDVPDTVEAPEADAVEQSLPAVPAPSTGTRAALPLEADDADAAEQALDVPFDEDEGRA